MASFLLSPLSLLSSRKASVRGPLRAGEKLQIIKARTMYEMVEEIETPGAFIATPRRAERASVGASVRMR